MFGLIHSHWEYKYFRKRVRSLRFLDKKVPRRNQKYILARKGKAKNGRENEVGDNLIAENVMLLRKKGIKRGKCIRVKNEKERKHQYSILMHIYAILKDGNDNPVCETSKEMSSCLDSCQTESGQSWG